MFYFSSFRLQNKEKAEVRVPAWVFHLPWICILCSCLLSALLLQGWSWVLSVGPLRRRWLHPFCCCVRDSSLLSFIAAHISTLIYSCIHVRIHSCVQPMDGCDLCHTVNTRDPRMSSTETPLSTAHNILGKEARTTWNIWLCTVAPPCTGSQQNTSQRWSEGSPVGQWRRVL